MARKAYAKTREEILSMYNERFQTSVKDLLAAGFEETAWIDYYVKTVEENVFLYASIKARNIAVRMNLRGAYINFTAVDVAHLMGRVERELEQYRQKK